MPESVKLTRIDESNIQDHSKLTLSDEVYFWKEYTSGRDYNFGQVNSLISNLKKKPSSSNPSELRHKSRVISECANFFSKAINMQWLKNAMVVPIPGSKIAGHPDYDDRLLRICREIQSDFAIDVRQIITQSDSKPASHEGQRPTVEDLMSNYRLDEVLIASKTVPKCILILDDVLTAGVHYRAVHTILQQRFPDARIVGVFIARRVFSNMFEVSDDQL